LLHLLGHDHRVALADLLLAEFLEVKVALVLITVAVNGAKETAASAREACSRI